MVDQELLFGHLRESCEQLARMPGNVGMKINNGGLFEKNNYNVVNKNINGTLFEMTFTIAKELKYRKVKMGVKLNIERMLW